MMQESNPAIATLLRTAKQALADGDDSKAWDAVVELTQQRPHEFQYQFLKGEIAFCIGQMDESVAAFDEVIRLQPRIEPRLWQRGLALYYADRFEDGVKQFETHQTVNSQDVENAVWHMLCAAKVTSIEEARKNIIPIERDTRIPMAEVHRMFAGRSTPEDVLKTAAATSAFALANSRQHDMQMYYAHLYIGLFEEMNNNSAKSMQSMQSAAKVNPMGEDNIMGSVAKVHLQLRQQSGNQPDAQKK